VHRRVGVVLEEQVVSTIDERATVRIVHPSVWGTTMQARERRIRMRGVHAVVPAPARCANTTLTASERGERLPARFMSPQ
jgi:hypothetical protein